MHPLCTSCGVWSWMVQDSSPSATKVQTTEGRRERGRGGASNLEGRGGFLRSYLVHAANACPSGHGNKSGHYGMNPATAWYIPSFSPQASSMRPYSPRLDCRDVTGRPDGGIWCAPWRLIGRKKVGRV
ncbi:hypothetical protein D1007_30627 [Hordeum vulgare]|nr:hypothetical protein D1007_30627 [Hordeum vulgare]